MDGYSEVVESLWRVNTAQERPMEWPLSKKQERSRRNEARNLETRKQKLEIWNSKLEIRN